MRENEGPGDEHSDQDAPNNKRSCVTQTEYFRYQLFPCVDESSHIFMAGKLFQEWIVDSWTLSEQARLQWIKKIGLNFDQKADVDLWMQLQLIQMLLEKMLGNGPHPSFLLCRKYPQYDTKLSECPCKNRYYGGADIFLTATADPNWPEVKDALLPGQKSSDRPDIIVRVFYAKIAALIKDICKNSIMGRTVAHVYTIEFQKRGLPHIHMIIFFHSDSKLKTPECTPICSLIGDFRSDITGLAALCLWFFLKQELLLSGVTR